MVLSETRREGSRAVILLAYKIPEVGDRVLGVPDEEVLRLLSIVLVTVNVGEDGRNLSVYRPEVRLESRLRHV